MFVGAMLIVLITGWPLVAVLWLLNLIARVCGPLRARVRAAVGRKIETLQSILDAAGVSNE